MINNSRLFAMTIPADSPEQMEAFQKIMDEINDATCKYIQNLAKELNVSEGCAADVWYLRTRSRWTHELEAELIRLHRAGTPPNVCEF